MEENRISTKRLLLRPYEEADRDPVIRIFTKQRDQQHLYAAGF